MNRKKTPYDPQDKAKLVLASGSQVRANILRGAGIDFEICPSQVDEDLLKGTITNGPDLALSLAAEKARAVADKYSDQLVLGADQILSCDGKLFDKHAIWMKHEKILFLCEGKRIN